MTTLKTLYKPTKTGAIQVCIISYENDRMFVKFGQLGGTMQSKETICTGKNIGKTNETTGTDQAKLEAIAKHTKKIKGGYSLDKTAPVTVRLPMKVKVWEASRFKPGFISTPKLNGINGIYRLSNNELTLWSRGGDRYPDISHLETPIKAIMKSSKSLELNVELYIHGEHLQDITSAVKKPKDLSTKLEAAIFDICDNKKEYKHRRNVMLETASIFEDTEYISFMTGIRCETLKDIELHYDCCVNNGLEGTVIKDPEGLYQHNIRSSFQWKYKKAQDEEFQVVGYQLDKNYHAVYTCNAGEKGVEFEVKRKGTNEERLSDAAIAELRIGQWLKVEYEIRSKPRPGFTLGKPLKPVGLTFRKCTIDGKPLD